MSIDQQENRIEEDQTKKRLRLHYRRDILALIFFSQVHTRLGRTSRATSDVREMYLQGVFSSFFFSSTFSSIPVPGVFNPLHFHPPPTPLQPDPTASLPLTFTNSSRFLSVSRQSIRRKHPSSPGSVEFNVAGACWMDIGPRFSSFPLLHHSLFRFFPSTISLFSSSIVRDLLSSSLSATLCQRCPTVGPNGLVTSRSIGSETTLGVLFIRWMRNISTLWRLVLSHKETKLS